MTRGNGNGPTRPTGHHFASLANLHGPGCRCSRPTTVTMAHHRGCRVQLRLKKGQPVRDCYGTITQINRGDKTVVLTTEPGEITIPLGDIESVYEISNW